MLRKIWGFHGGDYEECRLLGYKNPQETHYVSATGPRKLMLCKIWGFHGSDYEEWRLLGYKTPVRTSQETHYVSATESKQLMLCKIWGFHGGDYEEWRLLGCYGVWFLQEPHSVNPQKAPFFKEHSCVYSKHWEGIRTTLTRVECSSEHGKPRRGTILYEVNA
jgi:hypothetical protein